MYHINPRTGNAGPCRATKQCPFGSPAEHYATRAEARQAYEKTMVAKPSEKVAEWHRLPWDERKPIVAEWLINYAQRFNLQVLLEWGSSLELLGRTDHLTKAIMLTDKLQFVEEEKVKNTLIHELAHLKIGPGHQHNDEWEKLATTMAEEAGVSLREFKDYYFFTPDEQLRMVSYIANEAQKGWVTTCSRGHVGYEKLCPNSLMACRLCIDDGVERTAALLKFSPVSDEQFPPTYLEKARQYDIAEQAVGDLATARKILGRW